MSTNGTSKEPRRHVQVSYIHDDGKTLTHSLHNTTVRTVVLDESIPDVEDVTSNAATNGSSIGDVPSTTLGAPSNPSSPWNTPRPTPPEPKPPDTPKPKGNPSPSNPKPGNKKPDLPPSSAPPSVAPVTPSLTPPHSRSPTTAKFYSTPNARRAAPPPRPSGDLLPGAEVVQAAAGK